MKVYLNKHDFRLAIVGDKHWNSKIKEKDVPIIKKMLKEKIPHSKIAEKFGVTRECITTINRGVVRAYIADE